LRGYKGLKLIENKNTSNYGMIKYPDFKLNRGGISRLRAELSKNKADI
jgi:hypothetical protein